MELQIKVIDKNLLKHREHGHYHLLYDGKWTECACTAERTPALVEDIRPLFKQVQSIVFQTADGLLWCVTPRSVPFLLVRPLTILLDVESPDTPSTSQITGGRDVITIS